jgi:hypothetical protein
MAVVEVEVVQQAEEGEDAKVSYQLRSPRAGDVTSFHGGLTMGEFEQEIGKILEEPGASAE